MTLYPIELQTLETLTQEKMQIAGLEPARLLIPSEPKPDMFTNFIIFATVIVTKHFSG